MEVVDWLRKGWLPTIGLADVGLDAAGVVGEATMHSLACLVSSELLKFVVIPKSFCIAHSMERLFSLVTFPLFFKM